MWNGRKRTKLHGIYIGFLCQIKFNAVAIMIRRFSFYFIKSYITWQRSFIGV